MPYNEDEAYCSEKCKENEVLCSKRCNEDEAYYSKKCKENEVHCSECGDVTERSRDEVARVYSNEYDAETGDNPAWVCTFCLEACEYEPYMDGEPLEHQESDEFLMYVKELD